MYSHPLTLQTRDPFRELIKTYNHETRVRDYAIRWYYQLGFYLSYSKTISSAFCPTPSYIHSNYSSCCSAKDPTVLDTVTSPLYTIRIQIPAPSVVVMKT